MSREKITGGVLCFNEERKIRRCIESIKWCDELVVLDSFSTDRTIEICREYTDRIHQQEWLGYVGQRNLLRELASHPWVLFLDADEEVSPALRDEILAELSGEPRCLGYEFPRQVYYLGRWIRHGDWYPDVKLRLFKREFGRTEGEEPHDHVVVRGPVKRLRSPIWHYTYDDVVDQIKTLNRFSTITAQQKFVRGQRVRAFDLLFHPLYRFFRGYVLRRGFMDGTHGLVIAFIAAFGSFLKYAKHWELSLKNRKSYEELPEPGRTQGGFQ